MTCERLTVKKDVTEIKLRVNFVTCSFTIFKEVNYASVFIIKHNKLVLCHINYFCLIVTCKTCSCFIFNQ